MTAPKYLQILDDLPENILDYESNQLHQCLSGPTLIRLAGRRSDTLFISVLLHGNESTGWDAMRNVLKKYLQQQLPRNIALFIGNVTAARQRLRVLPGQVDHNRIWKGDGETVEHQLARELLNEVADMDLFAAIDIHNNTGFNPHYACVNRLDGPFLHLATLFSRTVVYFLNPDSVMSRAMARFCPAVTVECGKTEEAHGVAHASEYIDACLHLHDFPHHPVAEHDIDLFHTVAVVKISDEISFGFDRDDVELSFIPNIDRLNFQELPAGTILGHVRCQESPCLSAMNEQGENLAARYFQNDQGVLRLAVPLMPSMLTQDEAIIRQDCLCYLMERLSYSPQAVNRPAK